MIILFLGQQVIQTQTYYPLIITPECFKLFEWMICMHKLYVQRL